LIVFPNAKVNLGLRVVRKRPDGFHDIESVFYPIPLRDALEMLPLREKVSGQQDITLDLHGLPIQGNGEDNLCVKAYRLLKADFPDLPPVELHLIKKIPMGAGLGGGSANGSFMLKMINEKFKLGLSGNDLAGYALKLGSDCPFFLQNTPALGRGRGEDLSPVALDLSGFWLALVHPGIHINTGWAFSRLGPVFEEPSISLTQIIAQPVDQWKGNLKNDFETAVFKEYPELGLLKEELYGQGAAFAAMSGSGSTLFGLFRARPVLRLPHPPVVMEISPN
jgi:4-diphosphocytidyl-2-C-methyl-D-erythritol kinase